MELAEYFSMGVGLVITVYFTGFGLGAVIAMFRTDRTLD